jgi:hypothetical protein
VDRPAAERQVAAEAATDRLREVSALGAARCYTIGKEMGKGRDRRRRNARRKDEVRTVRVEPSGEPSGPIDPYAPVPVPLKPKPSRRSGAIALPQPDEPEVLPEAIGVRSFKVVHD